MVDHEASPDELRSERNDRVNAAVLAVASLCLYVLTRTRHFGGDDTVYALVVQRWLEFGVVERALFHPHHVLYNPLVGVCAWLVNAWFGSVFVLDVGAAVSAVAAAMAVGGLYLVLCRHGIDDRLALVTAAVLAVSGGLWRYATRMEVYGLAAAGVVVWLAAFSDQRAPWPKLAAGFAAPWLGHSVLGLLALPGAWLQRHRPRELGLAVIGGLVAPGLVVVGFLAWIHGARSIGSLVTTMVGSGSGRWLSLPDPVGALSALGGLVTTREWVALPVFPRWTTVVFDVVGVAVFVGIALLVVRGAVVAVRARHPLGFPALLGIVSLTPVWLVWDVGNHEHAVAALPLFAALAALGAQTVGRRVGVAALVAAFSCLLVVNGLGSAMLQTQPHLSRTLLVADHVRTTLPESATLVAVGVDAELRLSLPYLSGRRVVDLTAIVHSARRAGASPEEALERWLQRAAAADETWMLEDPNAEFIRAWVEELGIPAWAWREALARCRFGRASTLDADGIVMQQPVHLRQIEIVAPQEHDR